jgi:hypothetical protein
VRNIGGTWKRKERVIKEENEKRKRELDKCIKIYVERTQRLKTP